MKTIVFIVITTFSFALLVGSCNSYKKKEADDKLMATDIYWSDYSIKHGRNKAFIAMFDQQGVLLQDKSKPVEGIKSISEILLAEIDSNFVLSWKPTYSKSAESQDLGYTYGLWQMINKSNDSIIAVGTYATIWGKNNQGEWKALLDTGNLGWE